MLKKLVDTASLSLVMLLWGINLAYPLNLLQHIRWTLFGHIIPAYYFFTVLPITVAAAFSLAFKRRWTMWEALWWLLPLTCLPGIFFSADPAWSARQWASWLARGIFPGGIIFLISDHRRAHRLLICWIYPIIIGASLLGLWELYFNHNPLFENSATAYWNFPLSHNLAIESQPDNPFYRPADSMPISQHPQGTQGNRIPYAASIVAFLPLGIWLSKNSSKLRWAHFLAIGVLSSILLLAQVRTAWVGMFGMLILLQAFGVQRDWRQTTKIFSVVLVLFGIFLVWPKTQQLLLMRLRSFTHTDTSIHERIEVLQTARAIKDRWLFGLGFGQFPFAGKPYYQGKSPWTGTPDNQYLRWIIENGFVSFLFLSVFLTGLVRASWKKITSLEEDRAGLYKSLLISWLTTAITFLFFDGFYWGACNMTFWCLLGLLAGSLKSPLGIRRP